MKSTVPNLVVSDPSYLNHVLEIESIYNSAPVGLCVFDKDLRYIRLNQRFADMNGVSIEDHIGRTPQEIVPDLSEQALHALKEILRTGETLQAEFEGETPAHPGVKRYYDETWSPVRDPSGDIVGVSVVKECTDINELCRQTASDYHKYYNSKGISLDYKSGMDQIHIDADPARIAQILGNLLHNAAKFSEKGDQVTIRTEIDSTRSEAIVVVKDTGRGIPADILPDIFEPFVQADESLAREKGGIGLGLAIVKGMVELHEGSISVSSEGLNKGSEFTIRLPLSENKSTVTHDIQETRHEPSCGRLKILVIEDNPDLLEILCDLLGALGHDTEAAGDGMSGITKAREIKPDVILCDIGLPGINGYEVAERISRDSELKDIVLIALSGYAQHHDIEQSKIAGFRRHLAKPVQLEILKRALADAANT